MGDMLMLATGGRPTQDLSIFDPVSPPAESIRSLSVLVLAITAFIFIVVEGILVYSIVRFRRRRAAPGADATGLAAHTEPPQVYGSKPIEIAWTAAPALIVFVLVLVSARTLWEVNVPPPQPREGDNTLFVTVVGRQWWWEYTYDHYNGRRLGFTTANELHIPASERGVDRRVYLTLKSADVCHSFWVPRLAGKTDAIPGRVNSMWFQTDRPGLYLGQCAEYCGMQHANMLLRVVVHDSHSDFKRWLDHQQKARWPSRDDPVGRRHQIEQAMVSQAFAPPGVGAPVWPQALVASRLATHDPFVVDDPRLRDERVWAGEKAFLSQSCVKCHAVRGTPAKGRYGPDLTHLMSRQTLASGMVENTPENLRRWVADPQQIKPGCFMPAFGLGDRERNDMVRYLLTLR
jgi:cytochrome c oxidase subunit 2